jgi:polyhydroxybutyrate depolymerase
VTSREACGEAPGRASATRTAPFVTAALLLGLLGACTSDWVVIGARYPDSHAVDGGATVAPGTVGCNGKATPSTSPANGYLTMDVNGTTRQFVLELPTGYDGLTPVPVLLAFHGSGTNGQIFLGQDYGNVRAGVGGRALLVGPNALERGIGAAWVSFSGDQGNGVTQEDVDFFDALVAQLKANYCVDAERFFAMGHGDGGIIVNQLACLRGKVLRGVAPFAGAGPEESGATSCSGKVAAIIGHDPNEGDAAECGRVSSGSCPWTLLWAETGWPTTRYWMKQNGCSDPGPMPTAPYAGNGTTGNPLPCQSLAGCGGAYPVTLCLYEYWNQEDGPHAFPTPWAARAATDFFLALPRVQ